MVRVIASLLSFAALAVTSEGSGCRTGNTFSYAPPVSYYPPANIYTPVYTVQYGQQTSPETVELFRLFVSREEARDARDRERDAKIDALLQRVLDLPLPAKSAPKHPGLAVLANKCADCHDARGGKGKGDIAFLNGGAFLDEGSHVGRVLKAIDPWGPNAKGGKAHMPPKEKLTAEETAAVMSYLNWLPVPKKAEMPAAKPF